MTGGRGALGQGVVAVLEAKGAIVHLPPDPPALRLDDEAQATQWFAALPPLWASVHLVGGFAMKPILETTLADFEAQWRVNTVTCFLSCREAIRALRAQGGGRIVNVAARIVEQPVPEMVAYSIAKAGVAALTRALAVEVKSEGILVNAVLPSIIDTPANRAAMPGAKVERWPKPEQLARAILWLASPANELTWGALVPVYGNG